MGRKEPEPFTLKNIPVDQGFQLHQLMPHVDHLDQAGAQEVVLVRSRLFWLHITSRNCRASAPPIPDPAPLTQQIPAVYQYNQIHNGCSGRTTTVHDSWHNAPLFGFDSDRWAGLSPEGLFPIQDPTSEHVNPIRNHDFTPQRIAVAPLHPLRCPGHGNDEQSCEFVGVGNMGVFDHGFWRRRRDIQSAISSGRGPHC